MRLSRKAAKLSVQTTAFRLILKGVDDEIPYQVRLPGHTPGKLSGCAHALRFVREKIGQKLGYILNAVFIPPDFTVFGGTP